MAANNTTSFFLDLLALQYEDEVKQCHRNFDRVRNIMEVDNINAIDSVTMRLTSSDGYHIAVFDKNASTILTLLGDKLEGSCLIVSRSR